MCAGSGHREPLSDRSSRFGVTQVSPEAAIYVERLRDTLHDKHGRHRRKAGFDFLGLVITRYGLRLQFTVFFEVLNDLIADNGLMASHSDEGKGCRAGIGRRLPNDAQGVARLNGLRCSAGMALLFASLFSHSALPGWIQGVAILLSLALFAGYLTPVAAMVGLLLHALIWCRVGVGSAAYATLVILDLLSLALLGPGGYSADASLFGRRVIVVPPP